jgi:23S rRNA pseudouridine1911/1915/1917 synthase
VSTEAFEATPGRLDVVLASRLDVARADAQRAIAAGLVTVDGARRPKSFRLLGGETIEAELPEATQLSAEGPPLAVHYRDQHLIVVDKPAGLVTHPTEGRRSGTMVNRLLGMDVPLSTVGGPLRPGIVHRLDAGTSGLVVVACTDEAHEALAAMFHDHEVRRSYLALVRGVVEHDRFLVDAPLGRRRARIVVRHGTGKPAETEFAVRERFERESLLDASPRTGRTHQIRVHISSVGHPILGDRAYGGGGDDAKRLGLTRPFLHAWRLRFVHPISGDEVDVEAPLPDDLREALARAASAPG